MQLGPAHAAGSAYTGQREGCAVAHAAHSAVFQSSFWTILESLEPQRSAWKEAPAGRHALPLRLGCRSGLQRRRQHWLQRRLVPLRLAAARSVRKPVRGTLRTTPDTLHAGWTKSIHLSLPCMVWTLALSTCWTRRAPAAGTARRRSRAPRQSSGRPAPSRPAPRSGPARRSCPGACCAPAAPPGARSLRTG